MNDKKTENNEDSRNMIRAGIYPMLGLYLIYLAYSIIRDLSKSSGNEYILMIVCSIIFSISGAALILFGIRMWYIMNKKTDDDNDGLN